MTDFILDVMYLLIYLYLFSKLGKLEDKLKTHEKGLTDVMEENMDLTNRLVKLESESKRK